MSYFVSLSEPIKKQLQNTNSSYPYDIKLANHIHTIFQAKNIIAYCLADTSGSLIAIDGQNKQYTLLIRQPNDLTRHLNALKEFGDTAHTLYQQIESGKVLPYFGPQDEFWLADYQQWQKHIYPAITIQGDTTYYISLIES